MAMRAALLIGTRTYNDPAFAALETPNADVAGLADVLRDPQICAFDEVITLLDAPLSEVLIAISVFLGKAGPEDLVVLYFTGHGILDDQGRLFLGLRDTQKALLRATAVCASTIRDEMDCSRSRKQVLILDCCHSGAFARGAKSVEVGSSVGTMACFEGRGVGRIVLTASDATQYAFQGDRVIGKSSRSLFTHYLVSGLQSGLADTDGDGRITVDELYDYAFEQVVKDAPDQTPGKWAYRQQGDIVLARNPSPIATPQLIDEGIRDSILPCRPRSIRETGVRELAKLLRDPHPGMSLAAKALLSPLTDDDSRFISNMAREALAAVQEHDPPSRRANAQQFAPNTQVASAVQNVAELPLHTAKPSARALPVPGWRERRGRLNFASLALPCALALVPLAWRFWPNSEVRVVAAGAQSEPHASSREPTPITGAGGTAIATAEASPAGTAALPPPSGGSMATTSGAVSVTPSRASTPLRVASAAAGKLTPKRVGLRVTVQQGDVAGADQTKLKEGVLARCDLTGVTGSVVFRFVLDAEGAVHNPVRHKDKTLPDMVAGCAATTLKSMNFRAADPGSEIVLRLDVS